MPADFAEADLIEPEVAHDAVDPGIHPRLVAQLVTAHQHALARGLHQIVGVIPRPSDRQAKAAEARQQGGQ